MDWSNIRQQLETLKSKREFQPKEDSNGHCLKHNEDLKKHGNSKNYG